MAPPRGSPHFCFRGMLIMSDPRLPAEWEPQDAVMLTWPHRDSDWAPHLDDVTQLYEALVAVIVDYADVIIVVPEGELEAIRKIGRASCRERGEDAEVEVRLTNKR